MKIITLLLAIITSTLLTAAKEEKTPPNIVFILVDDLGWKDLGCTGSKFHETPALDALAESGARFTQAYAPHPVCGPSRCAILSGRSALRTRNTGVTGNLKSKEITIAEVFKKQGYKTFFAGKWHCGIAPKLQGFDQSIAHHHQGQPGSHHFPYKDTGLDWPGHKRKVIKARDVPDLSNGKEGEYLTDRLTEETIKFISGSKEQPFLAYLSHYAVHSPLESKKEYEEYFTKKLASMPKPDGELSIKVGATYFSQHQANPIYAGMVKSLDDSVGQIVEYLKKENLYDNTIIIFYSDNGGVSAHNKDIHHPSSNLPLRAGKGWNYEGGIRVPMIISYPKKIKAKQLIHTPVIGMDLFPTLLELSGHPVQPQAHRDGLSLAPLLTGGSAKLAREDLHWIFPQSHGSGHKPSAAIRSGNLKLIHFIKENRVELYDLSKDEAEQNDLSKSQPQVCEDLLNKLNKWRKSSR